MVTSCVSKISSAVAGTWTSPARAPERGASTSSVRSAVASARPTARRGAAGAPTAAGALVAVAQLAAPLATWAGRHARLEAAQGDARRGGALDHVVHDRRAHAVRELRRVDAHGRLVAGRRRAGTRSR